MDLRLKNIRNEQHFKELMVRVKAGADLIQFFRSAATLRPTCLKETMARFPANEAPRASSVAVFSLTDQDAAKFAPFRGAGRNQGYIPRRKAVKLRRGERAPPVPKYLLFLYIYVVTGPGLD
jgi:hypothetical protein